MIGRRDFLLRAAAAGAAPGLLAAAPAKVIEDVSPLEHALVLSGGGARGAYEAGIICELARSHGVTDGRQLLPYEFVAGTSIGALNGWFAATGQYSRLRKLWSTIGAQNILQLKPRFAKATDPAAGIATRIASALRMLELTTNEQGVVESQPVLEWMRREVDLRTPLLVPLVFATTDLTSQRSEYFYRLPANATGPPPDFLYRALQISIGPHVVVREATDDLLHKALLASASIPFVFDPTVLPGVNGKDRQYVDGGVASNSPVGVARTIATSVDIVLLDPILEEEYLASAVDIGIASFGTMQRKILETELRTAYFQSFAKSELLRLAPQTFDRIAAESGLLGTFLRHVPVTQLSYIRPEKTLPVKVGGFDDQEHINDTFDVGIQDVKRGFTPYDWSTFQY